MQNQINFENARLQPLTSETAAEISQWHYAPPYDPYSFDLCTDDYLLDESTWGIEQFCLMDEDSVLAQVACQYEGDDLWVGWSLAPTLCGKGNGAAFVKTCVNELRFIKGHTGRLLLRVAAWNLRAIKAYQKAGFVYVETIQDEIAYSGHMEDFRVMALQDVPHDRIC